MLTDRLEVQVNYILDSQNNGKLNIETVTVIWKSDQNHQSYEEICKKSKEMLLVLSSTEAKIPHNGGKLKFDTLIYKKNLNIGLITLKKLERVKNGLK